jgi:hypothetical protein
VTEPDKAVYPQSQSGPTPDDEPDRLIAAGGWCAPTETLYDLFPNISVARGGIRYPSAEEMAETRRKQAAYLHRTRWTRRRRKMKSWLVLRPLRTRIHNHIHRNCDDW